MRRGLCLLAGGLAALGIVGNPTAGRAAAADCPEGPNSVCSWDQADFAGTMATVPTNVPCFAGTIRSLVNNGFEDATFVELFKSADCSGGPFMTISPGMEIPSTEASSAHTSAG